MSVAVADLADKGEYTAPELGHKTNVIFGDPDFKRARQLYLEGALEKSEALFAGLAERYTNNPYVFCYQGMFASERKDYDYATSLLLKAHKLSDDPMILVNLGQCLSLQHKFDNAIRCFNKALKQDPNLFPAFGNLVSAIFLHGDMELCKKTIEHGLKRFPNNVALIVKKLTVLLVEGNTEEGAHLAEEMLNKNPGEVDFLRLSLEFGKVPMNHPAIEMAKFRASQDPGENKFHIPAISSANFSLFRHYEAYKEHEAAFAHLERANALRFSILGYDQAKMDAVFRHKSQVYNEDTITQEDEEVAFKEYETVPIFIVGMPRSGTSLTEQVLASHPDVFGAGEINEASYIFRTMYVGNPLDPTLDSLTIRPMERKHLMQLGGTYMRSMLDRTNGKTYRFTVDKMPQNFLNIAAIRRVFPHAKIIHTMRNPVDNCLSIYSKNFTGTHDYAYNQKTLGHYYCKYVELMEHWNRVLPGKIYNLQYETLVDDFENEVRKLLDFCGIPFHEDCLKPHETKRAVRTASASQVIKPIYKTSVEKWRRYEPWLGELIEALAPVYTPTPLEDKKAVGE